MATVKREDSVSDAVAGPVVVEGSVAVEKVSTPEKDAAAPALPLGPPMSVSAPVVPAKRPAPVMMLQLDAESMREALTFWLGVQMFKRPVKVMTVVEVVAETGTVFEVKFEILPGPPPGALPGPAGKAALQVPAAKPGEAYRPGDPSMPPADILGDKGAPLRSSGSGQKSPQSAPPAPPATTPSNVVNKEKPHDQRQRT